MSVGPAMQKLRQAVAGDELRSLSDAALLARYLADPHDPAFAVLVARHGPLVRGVCRRRLGLGPDADDAAQATFVILARNAARVRNRDSLAAWLHGVAVRVSNKARARRRPTHPPVDPPTVADPAAAASWRELEALIDDALAALPESLRLPVLLCGLHGLTRDEAAAKLGWSESVFRGRLERGRMKLKTALARRGVPVGAGLLTLSFAAPADAVGPDWVSSVLTTVAGPVPPTVSPLLDTGFVMKKWALVAGLVLALGAVAAGGMWMLADRPSVMAPPAKALVADPTAGPVPADLRGDWVWVQTYPDGTGRKTWRLKFVDGKHAVWTVDVKSVEVNQTIHSRRTFAFDKPDEVTFTTLEKFVYDEPMRLTRKEVGTFTFRWDDAAKGVFLLTPKPSEDNPQPTSMRFAKTEESAAADDLPEYLKTIDRTIKKEPKYASKTPGYLLLAVGPEAKHRVWVVRDDKVLYIDRNGNGDLTEEGEKVFAGTDLLDLLAKNKESGGQFFNVEELPGTPVRDLTVVVAPERDGPREPPVPGGALYVAVRCRADGLTQKTGIMQTAFADTPAAARVVHLASPERVLRRSRMLPDLLDANEPTSTFTAEFGTPGVGSASFVTVTGGGKLKNAHPIAEFAFPAKAAGDPPLKVTVKLNVRRPTMFGDVDQFAGTLTVPADVGPGPAIVTLSYPDCPLGPVPPRTEEVWFRPKKTN